MTVAEAAGIVTRIARYYPTWLRNLDEEEMAETFRAWAEEIAPLGELREVWPLVLEALRAHPAPWPPGVFELRDFVRRKALHRKSYVTASEKPEKTDPETAAYWLGEMRKCLKERGNAQRNHLRHRGNGSVSRNQPEAASEMDGGESRLPGAKDRPQRGVADHPERSDDVA